MEIVTENSLGRVVTNCVAGFPDSRGDFGHVQGRVGIDFGGLSFETDLNFFDIFDFLKFFTN